jgi:hypothetical protein
VDPSDFTLSRKAATSGRIDACAGLCAFAVTGLVRSSAMASAYTDLGTGGGADKPD